ncbi:hypothetical protein, partial [Nocardia mangyaensis]|uniref:hypothetical protein n=1 Tax=Nocardia mangyaensis TaxID=2213200 RepID=UPI00267527FF
RWKSAGSGPYWAYKALSLLSGDLSHLGWKYWQIEDGWLYNRQLNKRYYRFQPADLLVAVFCSCPGHEQLRRGKQLNGITELNRSPLGKGSGSLRYSEPG